MTTYQQIIIILDNFEIIFIGALFGPGTAVGQEQQEDRLEQLLQEEAETL